jgi:glutathione S-transferase
MESTNYWDDIDVQKETTIYCPGDVEQRPPCVEEGVRLYNNPLCPYSERGRLSLAARDVKFQTANLNLNHKPPYIVEAGGSVPILEKSDGTLIPGSDEIIKYAIEHGSGIELAPSDNNAREELDEYIKGLDKGNLIMTMVRALFSGGHEHANKLAAELAKIEEELHKNTDGNKFFNNKSEVTLADIYVAPILIRVVYALAEKVKTVADISFDKFPKIAAYVLDISAHPKLGPHIAPRVGFINYLHRKIKDSDFKLPYPIDLTPLEDSQSKKTLYVLNGQTAKPRTNENYIRLYGHPLCPFVERVILALKAKKVEYQF